MSGEDKVPGRPDRETIDEAYDAKQAVPASGSTGAPYQVGYKRPPLHSRFKAGERSRNPRGRPKGRVNLKTDLAEELAERVVLPQGDRSVRITKQRALVKSTVAKAIKGDARARDRLFDLVIRAFGIDDVVHEDGALETADEAILASFLARKTRGQT